MPYDRTFWVGTRNVGIMWKLIPLLPFRRLLWSVSKYCRNLSLLVFIALGGYKRFCLLFNLFHLTGHSKVKMRFRFIPCEFSLSLFSRKFCSVTFCSPCWLNRDFGIGAVIHLICGIESIDLWSRNQMSWANQSDVLWSITSWFTQSPQI